MPNTIRDRDEILLNAIATGDTTGIDPRDREETFLKAIADRTGELSDNKFIVTLTPTAPDFSGTMDKTVGEIIEAWEQGKDIWGVINAPTGITTARITFVSSLTNPDSLPSFNAIVINQTLGVLIFVYTGTSGDLSKNTYKTMLYTITPVS